MNLENFFNRLFRKARDILNRYNYEKKDMRSVQVSKAKGPLEIVERDVPEPNKGQVRIKVQACGICHSDSFTKEGLFPGIQYPRVPGHEIAGVIDEVGKDITNDEWKPGQSSCWLAWWSLWTL